jgi:hypothetical protein
MSLREEIANAINRNSAENGSNTPDFILARYLVDCLRAFDAAVSDREKWYGRANEGPSSGPSGGVEAVPKKP